MLFEYRIHRTVQQGAIPGRIQQPGIDLPLQIPGPNPESIAGIDKTNKLSRRDIPPRRLQLHGRPCSRRRGFVIIHRSAQLLGDNQILQGHTLPFQVSFGLLNNIICFWQILCHFIKSPGLCQAIEHF